MRPYGGTQEEIYNEVHRILKGDLDPENTIFSIPSSLAGLQLTKKLAEEKILICIHGIQTLQQAYMAVKANSVFLEINIGWLQAVGIDGENLASQVANMLRMYGYGNRVLFSGVQHPDHIRTALTTGATAISVFWDLMKTLPESILQPEPQEQESPEEGEIEVAEEKK